MFQCVYMHYYYIVPQLLSIELSCIYLKSTVIKYFYPSSAILFHTKKTFDEDFIIYLDFMQTLYILCGSVYLYLH